MTQGPGDTGKHDGGVAEGGLAAARRFMQSLAEWGELVRFGEVTIHVREGRFWIEIKKTYK